MIGGRWIAAFLIAAVFSGCATLARHRTPEERIDRLRLQAPCTGNVASGFGKRSGGRHAGIDILGTSGTEVRSASAGFAQYAGNGLRGYGNTVILDHGDGIKTLYGHLATIRVKSGEAVESGAVIGTIGRTGNATTNHLHFELRVDGEAVDPIPYLRR